MSANGLQIVAGSGGFQDFAQAPDMYIDGSLFQVCIGSPNMVKELGPAVAAPRMAHEKLQQAVFGWSHVNLEAIVQHAPRNRVQRQLAHDQLTVSSTGLLLRNTARIRAINSLGENGFIT